MLSAGESSEKYCEKEGNIKLCSLVPMNEKCWVKDGDKCVKGNETKTCNMLDYKRKIADEKGLLWFI